MATAGANGPGSATAAASNPRKFSEKIALQKQRQAEETAAFEEVMMDIGSTRVRGRRGSGSRGRSPGAGRREAGRGRAPPRGRRSGPPPSGRRGWRAEGQEDGLAGEAGTPGSRGLGSQRGPRGGGGRPRARASLIEPLGTLLQHPRAWAVAGGMVRSPQPGCSESVSPPVWSLCPAVPFAALQYLRERAP